MKKTAVLGQQHLLRQIWYALIIPALLPAPAYSADYHIELCLAPDSTSVVHDEQQTDAEDMLRRVQTAIGLADQGIKVVECTQAEKLASYVSNGQDGITPGKYVVFNPVWLREVAGTDRIQEIALLGHELGHILNDDFVARKDLDQVTKEADADHFAGCAVARLDGNWEPLQDLIERIRSVKSSGLYPDRLHSKEAAKQGFDACGGGKEKIVEKTSECPAGYTLIDDAVAEGNGACGFSLPSGAQVCLLHTKANHNVGCGFEIRGPHGESSAERACRVMFSLNNEDTRNYDYPVGPDKKFADCAARAKHDYGKYARVKCGQVYGAVFDIFDEDIVANASSYLPSPNCGW
jgi:hypothetical protein